MEEPNNATPSRSRLTNQGTPRRVARDDSFPDLIWGNNAEALNVR